MTDEQVKNRDMLKMIDNGVYNFPKEERVWSDDLIWCPSQCYYRFKYRDSFWVIYLRWRHGDPWKATLIECPATWDLHDDSYEWRTIPISHYKDTELDAAKDEAIKEAFNMIKKS
jgi:hypothetical protein